MPAQDWATEFSQAKAVAEAKRQEQHRAANEAFERERARITASRNELYARALDDWNRVKSDPERAGYDAIRAEYDRVAGLPANYRAAHSEMDAAISAADAEYNSTVDRLRREQLARSLADGAVQNEPIRR